MKEEKDQFEDFLHEMMQEGGLEQAPSGFTQRVMGEITAPQTVMRGKKDHAPTSALPPDW